MKRSARTALPRVRGFFEEMESRRLLAAPFFAGFSAGETVDSNVNGYWSARALTIDVDTTAGETAEWFTRSYAIDSNNNEFFLGQSVTRTAFGTGPFDRETLFVRTDDLGLPLSGSNPRGIFNFRFELYDAANPNAPVQVANAQNTPALANWFLETSAADHPGLPIVAWVNVTTGNTYVAGQTITFEARALSSVGVHQVSFWIDKNNDGFFTPGTDIDLGGSAQRISGTAQDGVWRLTTTVQQSWFSANRLTNFAANAALQNGTFGHDWAVRSTRFNVQPTISNLTVTPPPPASGIYPAGSQITLTATPNDSDGFVTAVNFFLDRGNNGVFDPGVDLDLGTDFNGADGWTRVVTLQSDWSPTATFSAVARDNDGSWGIQAAPTRQVSVALVPRVTNLTATPGAVIAGGQVTLTATVQATGATAVTFFRDVNMNGQWDAGIDIDLGADFNGSDGWSRVVTIPGHWPTNVRIAANVRDVNGNWGASPLTSTNVTILPAASVTNLALSPSTVVTWGDPLVLTATTSGPAEVVTFFFDRNGNGRWDPGIDVDIGADFDGSNGWSRSLNVPSSWGAVTAAQFVANARDSFGRWGTTGATATLRINDRPVVTQLTFTPNIVRPGQQITFNATVADTNPRAVTFFYDKNGNGRWDPGVDEDLGADFDGSDGWSLTINAPASFSTTFLARVCAAAVDFDNAWSANPSTSVGVPVAGPQVVTSVTPSSTVMSWNRQYTLTATVNPNGAAIAAVTFYFDANGNGRWDPGIDTDLGADFDGSNGWSVTFSMPQSWGAGTEKRFAANAVNSLGQWGLTATQSAPVRFNDLVFLSNGAANPSTAPLGSTVNISVNAQDMFGVAAVTFFLDVNNDGVWTPGVDIDLGVGSLTSGTTTNGTWSRNLTLSGLPFSNRGTFRIVADARDSDGVWSGRRISFFVTVT